MVGKNERENDATLSSDEGNRAEAYASKQISKKGATNDSEADRAEARRRANVTRDEAEQYLEKCEATAASDDRDTLKGERQRLSKFADDMLLPESFRNRALRLLGVIADQ